MPLKHSVSVPLPRGLPHRVNVAIEEHPGTSRSINRSGRASVHIMPNLPFRGGFLGRHLLELYRPASLFQPAAERGSHGLFFSREGLDVDETHSKFNQCIIGQLDLATMLTIVTTHLPNDRNDNVGVSSRQVRNYSCIRCEAYAKVMPDWRSCTTVLNRSWKVVWGFVKNQFSIAFRTQNRRWVIDYSTVGSKWLFGSAADVGC